MSTVAIFLHTVADIAPVYTGSGCKAAQCAEQLGHVQLSHPAGTDFLQRDWNSAGKRAEHVEGCIRSPPFSEISVAAEVTEGSAAVNVVHVSLLLTRAAVT